MWLAGSVALRDDVIFIVGALMMARQTQGPGSRLTVAGWLSAAVGVLLYIPTDLIFGHILSEAAGAGNPPGIYVAFRTMYDTFFALATLALGAGLVAIALPRTQSASATRVLRYFTIAAGSVSVIGGAADNFGIAPMLWRGIGIGLFGAASALVFLSIGAIRRAWSATAYVLQFAITVTYFSAS